MPNMKRPKIVYSRTRVQLVVPYQNSLAYYTLFTNGDESLFMNASDLAQICLAHSWAFTKPSGF